MQFVVCIITNHLNMGNFFRLLFRKRRGVWCFYGLCTCGNNKRSRQGPTYCYDITITTASQLWSASQFTEYFYIFIELSSHPWEVGIIVSLYRWEKLQGRDVQHCPRLQWWTWDPNLTLCLPSSPSFGHSSASSVYIWSSGQAPKVL